MTKRSSLIALCCCALAACGGDGDRANAATAKTFSYGAPEAAVPPSAGDAISALAAFQLSANEATAGGASGSLMQIAFESFPDDLGFGGFAATAGDPSAAVREARLRTFATAALGTAATQFDGECTATRTDTNGVTTVTFAGCQYSETSTDGTITVKASGKVQGQLGAVSWDMTYSMSMSGPDARVDFGYHDVGDVALAGANVKAHQEADVAASVAAGGRSATLGMAQSVDLDLTIDDACATTVTGGTLEAKRVWTHRPSGASAEELADRGVLFTWTGCGIGTVQFSR